MALTREDVVNTAVGLLDQVGLDGLTLRRLATELGVSAPTLYWHVKDKRELLDLMAERMMAAHHERSGPIDPGLGFWERVAEAFRRQYLGLIAHRDGARVVAGNRPTEASLPRIETFLTLWTENGFAPEEAMSAILTIGNFVIGSALEYQAEVERAQIRKDHGKGQRQDKSAYPTLKQAIFRRRQAGKDPHREFEYGLSLLIAGLKARHDHRLEMTAG